MTDNGEHFQQMRSSLSDISKKVKKLAEEVSKHRLCSPWAAPKCWVSKLVRRWLWEGAKYSNVSVSKIRELLSTCDPQTDFSGLCWGVNMYGVGGRNSVDSDEDEIVDARAEAMFNLLEASSVQTKLAYLFRYNAARRILVLN